MTVTVEHTVLMATFTTIGIGATARFFARVTDVDALRDAIAWSRDHSQPLFILGGGSNLLISDEGFDGLVVRLELRGMTVESEDNYAMVRVAAGGGWGGLVAAAGARGGGGGGGVSPGSRGGRAGAAPQRRA